MPANDHTSAGISHYQVTGMDCTSCVRKIESIARNTPGVKDVRVSLTSQAMVLDADTPEAVMAVERAVSAVGYKLRRLSAGFGVEDGGLSGENQPKDAHLSPSYKRALWIVVLLNIGYGLVEMIGGFVSNSQALKADALDFLGDGSITLLGLLAIGWSGTSRARVALLQGMFLALLGMGILIGAVYRVLVINEPNAELMGALGVVALVVNVAAALVLMKHREGDANVRAVWLFSRNDAIGNLAVVVAAGLVAWTGTSWPDLAVAIVIATLFLQSAWRIIGDARTELKRGSFR